MEKNLLDTIANKFSKKSSKTEKYKSGLVLSGGAARGFAHLGVLKALEEKNMKPDIVSGVSAGSIVGSFYADGYKPDEILEIFEESKIFELVKVLFKKQGLFDISGLEKVLKKNLKSKTIEELNLPLVIAATNIKKGTTKYFKEGKLIDAVMASSSIPVVFKPREIGGVIYVDGGVTNNFPVEPIQDVCKKMIGVHVNPTGICDPAKGLGHIALHSFHLSIASNIQEKKKLLEYFIEPEELKNYAYYDVSSGKEMFDIGYKEALKVLDISSKKE
jgi:NTE family protein